MRDTAAVAVEVLRLDPVNRGPLLALAVVEIEVDGIALRLQGVRVLRNPGGVECAAPVFRGPDGRWYPAAVLPPEVQQAIADVVLDQVSDPVSA